jgi:parallel beta-helix repeat protein
LDSESIETDQKLIVTIKNSVFTQSLIGIRIAKLENSPENVLMVFISNSTIASSTYIGIWIKESNYVSIFNNKVLDNEVGISIIRGLACDHAPTPVISEVEFVNHSRAVGMGITFCRFERKKQREAVIRGCTFDSNKNVSSLVYLYDTLFQNAGSYSNYDMAIQIENCQFINNVGRRERKNTIDTDCSLISTFNLTVVMNNASFINNTCTAILLNSTALKVEKDLYFIRNYVRSGSAIHIVRSPKKSSVIFYPNTSIHCIENRATKFGGAIYSGETCDEQRKECFFQLELVQTFHPTFYFTRNTADEGGDVAAYLVVYSNQVKLLT